MAIVHVHVATGNQGIQEEWVLTQTLSESHDWELQLIQPDKKTFLSAWTKIIFFVIIEVPISKFPIFNTA